MFFSVAFHLSDLCQPLSLFAVGNKVVNIAVKYFMGVLMIIDFLPKALSVYVSVLWSRAVVITCRDQLLIYHLKMEGASGEY